MKDSFLPEGYKPPVVEGNYFKFKKGINTFRILSNAVVGFEYWDKNKKPVRSRQPWEETPSDMQEGSKIRHFWAFLVWNYEAKKVQILEITQSTIREAIEALNENPKWGSPLKYDLVIKAEGDDLERTYTVMPEPHSEAPKADISGINLEALFDGADPFSAKTEVTENDF